MECVQKYKLPSRFCSRSCAEKNFQAHREDTHFRWRDSLGITVDDTSQLKFDKSLGPNTYVPAKGSEWLISYAEIFGQCRKDHPEWTLSTTSVSS